MTLQLQQPTSVRPKSQYIKKLYLELILVLGLLSCSLEVGV